MLVTGCGNERAPWSGFELFPPDAAVPELAPELLPGVLAALAAANATRGAAGAGVTSPGATTAIGAVSAAPMQSGASAAAGVGAAESASQAEAQPPQPAADSGAGQAGSSAEAGGAAAERPRWSPGQLPSLPWAGRAAPRGWPGQGGEGGALAENAGAGASSSGNRIEDAGMPTAADGGTPLGMGDGDAGPQ